jgi:hypothetical protein
MATNNTYINAQDDFIVKGNLTVEGNVTQVSTTINENRVAAEEFIINSDGENTTAKITFNSNNTFANISYLTGGNLVVEPNLQGNIIIGAGQTLTVASGASISGNVFTGSLAGVADEAKMFTNSVEVTLAGDATSTGGQFQGAGNVATLQTTLASVNSNPGSYGDATTVPVITVDAKGRITAASEIAVSVTASQVSDFTSAARAVNSGSLGVNYNSTTGAISLTQFGGAGQYGSATAVPQIVVDNGGRISSSSNVNIQLPKSQVTNFDSEVRTLIQLTDAGGDGSLTYNSGSGTFVFTGVAPSETRAHFSAVNVSGDGSLAYNNGTGAFSYTGPSAAETRAHFSGGSGIDINSGVITPDSTVVRTSGNQTIAGNKTLSGDTVFTGEVDLTGATIPGTVTFSGNIVATNIDTVTQTDSLITDNNIYLNKGGSDRDAKIHVQHTGANVYLKWDEGTDRWQFSNNGSTDNDLLLKTDFSASSGINYNSSTGAFTADTSEIRGLFSGSTGITLSSGAISITNSGVSAATYGSATAVPQVAINAQGQITSASAVNIAIPSSAITDFNSAVGTRVDAELTGGDGIDYTAGTIDVDSTVIRTTGNQSLAGDKTFTGKLVVPTTATTEANALYSDGNEAYIYINGVAKQITPTASVGSVEDVGTGEIDIYAGSRVASNVTYHGIKSLSSGTYTSVSENANVVTVEGDITAIRGAFSAVDNAGDGTFTYNSSTGAFSYSGISTAQVRTNFSASGSISYDSGTGVFTSSADNYSNWQLNTDSGSANAITSGEIVTFSGGTGINVSNNGNTVTIASTNTADITAVTAGTGLTGGGTSGAVTLTANASYIRTLFNGGGDIAYDPNTGTISFTNDAGDITAVTAGTNLTGGGTTGAVTLNLDTSSDIDMNGNKVLFGNMYGTEGALPSASTYHGMFAHVHGTGKGYFAHGGNWIKLLDETSSDTDDLTEGSSNLYHTTARVRAAISATAPLSYNSSTGVISLTEVGDITQVNITAGTGLSGSVNTTTGAHTQTIDLMEATSSALGGIKVGYTENSQNYPVELSSGKAFVSVPWVDTNTNTTYSAGTGLSLNGTQFNVGDLTVDELAPAFIIKSTESFANNDTTIMTSAAIEDKILSYGYTTDVGDITGVTAGTGLSGGGSSGSVTLNVSGLTVSELASSTLQTSGESFADNDTSLMTSAAIQDKITSYGYTTTVGDITAVVAGNGLSGGASSGSATLNVDLTDTAVFTSTNTASKAVVRDGSGNFAAGTISATATQAQYADLAENYVADADYEPGTVLILGGEHEVTTTDEAGSYKAVGVVSTDPAHLMNSTCEGEHVVAVALRGRVPCKVIGNVNKGDVLVASDTPGYAMVGSMAHTLSPLQIVGRAITSKLDAGNGVVEIIV